MHARDEDPTYGVKYCVGKQIGKGGSIGATPGERSANNCRTGGRKEKDRAGSYKECRIIE